MKVLPMNIRDIGEKVLDDYQSKQFMIKEIAQRNECSTDSVRRILKRAGYTDKLYFKKDINETEMIELYLSGITGVELGKKYGVDNGIIYARLKKLGVESRRRKDYLSSYHRKDIPNDEVISLFNGGMIVADIARKFNCDHDAISSRLTKAGINFRHSNKKVIGKDQEIIDDYLSGLSASKIGIKYDISNVSVINRLIENNIDRRNNHDARMQYPYDEHFFDVIDTEAKAYFLGFLLADGSNNEKDGSVHLSLTDYEPVKQFAEAVQTKRPIYEGIATTHSKKYTLSLSGRYFSKQLADKGCMQTKTFKLNFPTIDIVPDHLIHHLCRGYFDGDGCIHIRKNSENRVVHILGTEAFMKGMQNILPITSFVKQRSKNKIWYLGIYRKKDIEVFSQWLYKDATYFMERKKNKFKL